METEKRRVPRYSFSATARISDGSGAEIEAEVTDVSVCGCGLRVKRCVPPGAQVQVKIQTATESFQAPAIVVYATANETGLMFRSVAPEFLPILHKWVVAARSAA